MTEGEWLVVMALPLEAQDVFERAAIPVLYTGVGKVNAAMTLTRALAGYRQAGRPVPRVVNFGTAGSRRFATGTIVACTSFHQPDMDVSVLGFERGITPYEEISAHVEGTAFACAKYISDGADHAASSDWQANLHRAADQFLALYGDLQQSCAPGCQE